MKFQEALTEVEDRLKKLSSKPREVKYLPEYYVGNGVSHLRFLNLKVPDIRGASKKGFSFSGSDPKELWKIWDYIWKNSSYYEALLSAVHFANSRPLEEIVNHQEILLSWIDRVDNWALSDELSSLYAKLLEAKPKSMLPHFKKWNKSDKPWEARQSIVGLQFYSRFREKVQPYSLISKFISNLMDHEHFYVQRGVGWALRECWNVYPKETLKLIESEVKRIPPAGWTAATEKLPKSVKARLVEKRRKN